MHRTYRTADGLLYTSCFFFFTLVEPRPRYGLLAPKKPVLVTPVTIGCLAPFV
uniref:Uncharacterized protein n=1 Tax=uncultured marine virus TaxID=186617 RepID=A0A0F7L8J8_9VIRU|nr:hypothetical protein [uncultured marine virus]